MRKVSLLIVGLLIVGFAGTCMYFVAGVSAVNPPIKKYEFSGTIDHLIHEIQRYSSIDSNVTIKITDLTGDKKDGYGVYFDVKIKLDTSLIIYKLECEKSNKSTDVSKTLIKLIGAFNDKNYNVGGYGIEATGVKKMVYNFDTKFLTGLRQKQHLAITQL